MTQRAYLCEGAMHTVFWNTQWWQDVAFFLLINGQFAKQGRHWCDVASCYHKQEERRATSFHHVMETNPDLNTAMTRASSQLSNRLMCFVFLSSKFNIIILQHHWLFCKMCVETTFQGSWLHFEVTLQNANAVKFITLCRAKLMQIWQSMTHAWYAWFIPPLVRLGVLKTPISWFQMHKQSLGTKQWSIPRKFFFFFLAPDLSNISI